MIIAHSGTPGSGKTYDAVVRIVANLKKGRQVYTNIEGFESDNSCREMLRRMSGLDEITLSEKLVFLNEQSINDVWSIESPALIVLDELQNYFGNRDWQTAGNKNFNKWASVHRHKGQDLIVISQSIEGLDAQLRRMIEWTYDYRKINFLGGLVSNSYISYIYPQDNINQKYLDKKTYQYDKRYFACYKSYISQDITELKIVKGTNIIKHPVFYVLPLVVVFALYMFFAKSSFATGSLFGATKSSVKLGAVSGVLPNVAGKDKNIESAPELIITNNDKELMQKAFAGVPVPVKMPDVINNNKNIESVPVVSVSTFAQKKEGNKILLYESGSFVGSIVITDYKKAVDKKKNSIVCHEDNFCYDDDITKQEYAKLTYDDKTRIKEFLIKQR